MFCCSTKNWTLQYINGLEIYANEFYQGRFTCFIAFGPTFVWSFTRKTLSNGKLVFVTTAAAGFMLSCFTLQHSENCSGLLRSSDNCVSTKVELVFTKSTLQSCLTTTPTSFVANPIYFHIFLYALVGGFRHSVEFCVLPFSLLSADSASLG